MESEISGQDVKLQSIYEAVMKKKKNIIAIIVAIILGAYAFYLPSDGLDNNMRGALAILLFASILWLSEAVPLYLTAIIIAVLEVLLIDKSVFSASAALAPFFNTTIALFFGGFVLAAALNKYSVDLKIAKVILSKVGNKPSNVLFGMMGITAFLSMWMSNTATTALMIALALPIYSKIPKDEKFKKALILGIPFAANIGGMATPVGTPPNSIVRDRLASSGIDITFQHWMVLALPVTLILFFFAYFLLYYAFKPKLKELPLHIKCEEGFDIKQKYIVFIFILTVFFWVTSSYSWNKDLFQSSGIIALIPVIAFFGVGILKKYDLQKLNWDVLLLMGGGMSLGSSIKATGLDKWIISQINYSSLSFFILILVFTAVALLMSTFMSNTSTAALLAPILLGIGIAEGDPKSLLVSAALGCSIAMALPVSTPPNAIAYGTEEIEVKHMFIFGGIIGVVGLILLTIAFGI